MLDVVTTRTLPSNIGTAEFLVLSDMLRAVRSRFQEQLHFLIPAVLYSTFDVMRVVVDWHTILP